MKNLTDEQRHEVKDFLLENAAGMILDRGKINEAAQKWGVHRKTISVIWNRAKVLREQSKPMCVNSKRKGKKSRPKLVPDRDRILAIDQDDRSTIEGFAIHYGCSMMTICRWIKQGLLRSHTNVMHPQLTSEHKLLRLKFSLGALIVDSMMHIVKFNEMKNVVHIDEKWFNMSKKTEKFILLPEEENPYRSCPNTQYITKVMFLCAVARPWIDANGVCTFDGKIGIWPFTEWVPAARRSRNRPRHTLELKPMKSVNQDVMCNFLVEKVIPAIKEKWPASASKEIIIQQDNATPHIRGNEAKFVTAATSDGFNISLVRQPAKSPDFNINDLGFFASIQSLKNKTKCRNIQELVDAVESSFIMLEPSTLNRVFLSLQGVMIEVLKSKGHNDYDLPHLKKAMLERQGLLPQVLEVDEFLVRDCLEYLLQLGQALDNEELNNMLGH